MKRSTASWTTAVAASALLALPVGSWAQQPTPSTTPRQQTTGAPAPQTGRTPGADTQQGSANEHLRQAQSALADIPAASLTGTAKTRVAELKRHLNALEQAASQKPAAGASTQRSASWSGDVAAADRILSELLGPASTTGATTPAPAGTTGSTAAAPKTTTGGKPAASMTLDEPARTKLQEVRTHVTAFAAAMSGAASPSPAPTPSSDDPSSVGERQRRRRRAIDGCGTAGTTATPAPTGTRARRRRRAEPTATPATPATPAEPAAAAAATPAQSSTQPPAATPATPSPTPSQQVDAETVKRHLTAARDSLSQLTQLPAAAQLTGDARTQVSQLISNFNELITTNVDWRAAYTKLQGNLTALVGEQRADESPAPAPAGATAGAVGTSGTVAIDPAIRAKLVEFRAHLMEFEKAAGGSGAPAASGSARRRPRTRRPSRGAERGGEHHRALRRRAPRAPASAPRRSTAASTAEQHDRVAGAGGNDRQHVADPCDGGHFGHGHADAGSLRTGQPSRRRRAVMRRRGCRRPSRGDDPHRGDRGDPQRRVAGRHERPTASKPATAWNARPRADRTDPHAPRAAAQGTEQERR